MECHGCNALIANDAGECPECGLNLSGGIAPAFLRWGTGVREAENVHPEQGDDVREVERDTGAGAAEYRVEPFMGRVSTGPLVRDSEGTVARQLADLINRVAGEGWEYAGIEQVNILMSPSCLGYIFGQRQAVVPFDMVVFRRRRRKSF